MIAAQLIAAYNATMECYRRAMVNEQTFESRRENLSQANKLSRTYAVLLDALNRHRGKGQQKVTVEHVHVHSGGQAIVGAVESSGGAHDYRPTEIKEPTRCETNYPCTAVRDAKPEHGGHRCQAPAMPNGRCRMHGGMSRTRSTRALHGGGDRTTSNGFSVGACWQSAPAGEPRLWASARNTL
jgi:hypothetical protein